MKRIHRKIVSVSILIGCALTAAAGTALVKDRIEKNSLPVSGIGIDEELPVIILDAGHGEST